MRGCTNRNDIYQGYLPNRGECSSKCNDINDCISFEWYGDSNPHVQLGVNYCYLSSSCTYNLSMAASSDFPTDLYVKGN